MSILNLVTATKPKKSPLTTLRCVNSSIWFLWKHCNLVLLSQETQLQNQLFINIFNSSLLKAFTIFNALIIISCGAFIDLRAFLKAMIILVLVLLNSLAILTTMHPLLKNRWWQLTNAASVRPLQCSFSCGLNFVFFTLYVYRDTLLYCKSCNLWPDVPCNYSVHFQILKLGVGKWWCFSHCNFTYWLLHLDVQNQNQLGD